MGFRERLALYKKLEKARGRPMIAYVTSNRGGLPVAQIAEDAVREIHLQLQALPTDTDTVDLLLVSNGGDGTVAWRIVSLIRERVRRFAVLVPAAAFSAATLIALGADEIVMHPNGNLGPTDPQITTPPRKNPDGTTGQLRFGYEDLAAFLKFAKEEVGLSDQVHLQGVFAQFCQEVGSVGIGVAARSSHLTVSMGEQLLGLHMKDDQKQEARAISEALNKKFFHHGYPVSRKEAKKIGLKIAESNPEIERLMWQIWEDIAEELELREPFQPLALLRGDPGYSAIFGPVPQVMIPANCPPQLMQQIYAQVCQQAATTEVPPKDYRVIHAVMESPRVATRFVADGGIFASRSPDLQVKVTVIPYLVSWRTIHPAQPAIAQAAVREALLSGTPSSGAVVGTVPAGPVPPGLPLVTNAQNQALNTTGGAIKPSSTADVVAEKACDKGGKRSRKGGRGSGKKQKK